MVWWRDDEAMQWEWELYTRPSNPPPAQSLGDEGTPAAPFGEFWRKLSLLRSCIRVWRAASRLGVTAAMVVVMGTAVTGSALHASSRWEP